MDASAAKSQLPCWIFIYLLENSTTYIFFLRNNKKIMSQSNPNFSPLVLYLNGIMMNAPTYVSIHAEEKNAL